MASGADSCNVDVSQLEWLTQFTGWPYSLFHFTQMLYMHACVQSVSVYSLSLGPDRPNDATIIHLRTSSLINYVTII